MTKKVAIIGLAGGWQSAPWGDPSWERWSINDGYLLFGPDRKCTRWFELHGDTPLTRARRNPDHFDRIRAMDIPVYYLHGNPPAPNAIKLDADALAAVWRDYFTWTGSYQVALALTEGFLEIAVYGAPLTGNREAVVERPCMAWWLGLAEGHGITVTVHHDDPTGLLRHPYRYALEDHEERTATYYASLALRSSLDAWLPLEAERLGFAEPMMLEDA